MRMKYLRAARPMTAAKTANTNKGGFVGKEPEAPGTEKVKDPENEVLCEGCNEAVHYTKMMKTHQLGGNVRKEQRCKNCHDEFQNGVYATQMLEAVHGCSAHLDRFSNWATNPEVRAAIIDMLEKGVSQLGLKVRGGLPSRAPAEGEEKEREIVEGWVWLAALFCLELCLFGAQGDEPG